MNASTEWAEALFAEAMAAIERGDPTDAIQLLHRISALAGSVQISPARILARLALAHFRWEQYGRAADYYRYALSAGGGGAELGHWREMRALAAANARAKVEIPIPAPHYFRQAELIAPPVVRAGALPPPPPAPPRLSGRRLVRKAMGEALGAVCSAATELAVNVYGRIAGYHGEVWTNWYERPQFRAILTLAYMRERLNAHNLGTSYPPGCLVGFQIPGQTPPPGVSHYRTADGSWNNLADPKEGAAGTRFLRNVELTAIRPEIGAQLLTPNPREISCKLLSRPTGADGRPAMQAVPFLNLLAASWIQFMTHDWINHGEICSDGDAIEVPLPDDDVARARYGQTRMLVGRSQPDPTRREGIEVAAASSINEVTHWWDGSQIYGSDQDTQDSLRSHVGGKMRVGPDGRLPVDNNGVELAGFRRNWWVGLAMLHTLFVREHNAICDELQGAYPQWNDNRLFNVARLINAAVMAKIHTVEWTPAILPHRALNTALNANWFGLLVNFFRHGKARKTVDEIKVRNAEVGGVVGNPIDKHGRSFGLTEEFVEVYRLHSLLPEDLVLQRHNGPGVAVVPLRATRQSGSPRTTQRHSLADLFYSFGVQHPGALVLNNFPRFMQELSIPGHPFFDVGTVDIVRARERGVPRYNEFRRQLGLNPIRCFADLTDDPDEVRKLEEVYGANPADVEKLDLLIGTLAEGHRPTHFGFGETMFQIFILNATRRLQADRFYTDCFTEEYYTPEGLRWIDAVDFKTVLLRHFPELSTSGLANIRNAFEPWDPGPELDPTRHPLRAYDPELKANPWHGDAHSPFNPAEQPR